MKYVLLVNLNVNIYLPEVGYSAETDIDDVLLDIDDFASEKLALEKADKLFKENPLYKSENDIDEESYIVKAIPITKYKKEKVWMKDFKC